MKNKRWEDYTDEERRNLSYSEQESLQFSYYTRKIIKYSVIAIVVIFAIVTLFNSFKTIPTGYVGVKTQFGKVQDTMLNEGMNFKVPYIEKIVNIDCRTQKCEYEMEASSRDLQKISAIKIAVNYNVDKSKANQLYKNVGVDFKGVIVEPAIYESVKQGMSQYTAEELVTKRGNVANVIVDLLTDKLQDKGILVTALNITDLNFSKEFDDAIEKKQITEQQTEQAKKELEKAKIENEKKVENAKAEAEVMKQQNKQITEETLKLKELEVQQKLIEKWDGKLSTYMLGDTMPFFNIGD